MDGRGFAWLLWTMLLCIAAVAVGGVEGLFENTCEGNRRQFKHVSMRRKCYLMEYTPPGEIEPQQVGYICVKLLDVGGLSCFQAKFGLDSGSIIGVTFGLSLGEQNLERHVVPGKNRQQSVVNVRICLDEFESMTCCNNELSYRTSIRYEDDNGSEHVAVADTLVGTGDGCDASELDENLNPIAPSCKNFLKCAGRAGFEQGSFPSCASYANSFDRVQVANEAGEICYDLSAEGRKRALLCASVEGNSILTFRFSSSDGVLLTKAHVGVYDDCDNPSLIPATGAVYGEGGKNEMIVSIPLTEVQVKEDQEGFGCCAFGICFVASANYQRLAETAEGPENREGLLFVDSRTSSNCQEGDEVGTSRCQLPLNCESNDDGPHEEEHCDAFPGMPTEIHYQLPSSESPQYLEFVVTSSSLDEGLEEIFLFSANDGVLYLRMLTNGTILEGEFGNAPTVFISEVRPCIKLVLLSWPSGNLVIADKPVIGTTFQGEPHILLEFAGEGRSPEIQGDNAFKGMVPHNVRVEERSEWPDFSIHLSGLGSYILGAMAPGEVGQIPF